MIKIICENPVTFAFLGTFLFIILPLMIVEFLNIK